MMGLGRSVDRSNGLSEQREDLLGSNCAITNNNRITWTVACLLPPLRHRGIVQAWSADSGEHSGGTWWERGWCGCGSCRGLLRSGRVREWERARCKVRVCACVGGGWLQLPQHLRTASQARPKQEGMEGRSGQACVDGAIAMQGVIDAHSEADAIGAGFRALSFCRRQLMCDRPFTGVPLSTTALVAQRCFACFFPFA